MVNGNCQIILKNVEGAILHSASSLETWKKSPEAGPEAGGGKDWMADVLKGLRAVVAAYGKGGERAARCWRLTAMCVLANDGERLGLEAMDAFNCCAMRD